MRSVIPLFLLAGCHVLDDGSIQTTCEDLGDCAGGEGVPFSGWLLGVDDSSVFTALLLDVEMEPARASVAVEGTAQALAFNPVSGLVSLAQQDQLKQFNADGEMVSDFLLDAGAPRQLLQQGGSEFLLFAEAGQTWVERLGPGSTTPFLAASDFDQIQSLSQGPGDEIYVLDWTVSGHIWSVDISDVENPRQESLFAQYDSEPGRSISLFPGPGGAPYTCSPVGAMYAVADLFEGEIAPYRVAVEPHTDVIACAYDPSTDLLWTVSATQGVSKVNAGNESEVVLSLEEGDGAQILAASPW